MRSASAPRSRSGSVSGRPSSVRLLDQLPRRPREPPRPARAQLGVRDHQATARLEQRPDAREDREPVAHRGVREAEQRRAVRPRRRERRGVGTLQVDVRPAASLHQRLRPRQHALRDVDSVHGARRTDLRDDALEVAPAAAAQLEHDVARRERERIDRLPAHADERQRVQPLEDPVDRREPIVTSGDELGGLLDPVGHRASPGPGRFPTVHGRAATAQHAAQTLPPLR